MTNTQIEKQVTQQITTPDAIARELLQLKHRKEQIAQIKKQIDAEYDEMREKLLDATRGHGVKTLKTEEYIIVRQARDSWKVINEYEALEDMRKREIDPIMRLDTRANQPLFKTTPIKGIEKVTTEYITIKAVKENNE